MLSFKDYLHQFIETYLFHDIETMVELKTEKTTGRLGYPLVMTVCAGMEVLGELSIPKEVDPKNQSRFVYYWKEFLTPVNPTRYRGEEMGKIFYANIRHGIAHRYLTKGYALISKDKSAKSNHMLKITLEDLQKVGLWIDAIEFAEDFLKSYKDKWLTWSQSPEANGLIKRRWEKIDRDISSKDFIESPKYKSTAASTSFKSYSSSSTTSASGVSGPSSYTAPPLKDK